VEPITTGAVVSLQPVILSSLFLRRSSRGGLAIGSIT